MHPDLEPTDKAWQTIIEALRLAAEHYMRQANLSAAKEAYLLSNLFDGNNPTDEQDMYQNLRRAGLLEPARTSWAVSRAKAVGV